jgi:hypothetical protein
VANSTEQQHREQHTAEDPIERYAEQDDASPENAEKVKPGFIAILRQMAVDEATVLNWIYNHTPNNPLTVTVRAGELFEFYRGLFLDTDNLEACTNGLEAGRLIHGNDKLTFDKTLSDIDQWGPISYSMTARGRAFIEACRPPKLKS